MTERTRQIIQEIAQVYDVNAIYAQHVFFAVQKTGDPLLEAKKIILKKPKPFVKWVGGKRQLLKQFRTLGLYPPEGFDPNQSSYFEPFVGGGAVFFDLLPKKAFLSDRNFELVKTFNVIKEASEELIANLKRHKNTKEYFLKIRKEDPRKLSDLQIASRFIFLNRTAFNGLYRVNSSGGFNAPFGKYKNPLICDEENLRKVSKVLHGVKIENKDYTQAVKSAKKGDFIYFDPPYHPVSKTSSFTAYTSQGFGEKDQITLRDTVLDLHRRGCFVMLSNSDALFINEIYKEVEKEGIFLHKILAGRAINARGSGRGKVKEVLVVNY